MNAGICRSFSERGNLDFHDLTNLQRVNWHHSHQSFRWKRKLNPCFNHISRTASEWCAHSGSSAAQHKVRFTQTALYTLRSGVGEFAPAQHLWSSTGYRVNVNKGTGKVSLSFWKARIRKTSSCEACESREPHGCIQAFARHALCVPSMLVDCHMWAGQLVELLVD
jgi:hypothetical protein